MYNKNNGFFVLPAMALKSINSNHKRLNDLGNLTTLVVK